MMRRLGGRNDVPRQIGPPMTTTAAADDRVDVSLADLVAQVQEGDDRAFRELYALTHRQLLQAVDRTTRAPDHTVEVVQDVYLYVWQHARTFDTSRGSVLGWLLMLAHRRAVDRVRHVSRATVRDQRCAAEADLPVEDAAVLGIARHEATQVREALRRLSDRQREAVALTFLHGYSHREAALHLQVPLGTLKTRVRNGLASLRVQLGPRVA